MTPELASALRTIRKEIEWLEKDIFAYQEKDWVTTRPGRKGEPEDINAIIVGGLRKRIEALQAVVDRLDPEGFTAGLV